MNRSRTPSLRTLALLLLSLGIAGCSRESGEIPLVTGGGPLGDMTYEDMGSYNPQPVPPLPAADPNQFLLLAPVGTDVAEIMAGLQLVLVDVFPYLDRLSMFVLQGDENTDPEGFASYPASSRYGAWGRNHPVDLYADGGSGLILFIGGEWDDVDVNGRTPLARLHLRAVHQHAQGRGVVIGVVDTGADLDHPALVEHVEEISDARMSSWEEPGNNHDDDDDGMTDEGFGHGTFVSTIAAEVAPEATIRPYRALGEEGRGSMASVIYALGLAAQDGCNVVNLSLTLSEDSEQFSRVIDDLHDRGVAVVAAGGNNGFGDPRPPATYSKTFGVAATDAYYTIADFSAGGTQITAAAIGVELISGFPGGGYARASGTSMACPVVSGTIALGIEKHGVPALTSAAYTRNTSRAIAPANATQCGVVFPLDLVTMNE